MATVAWADRPIDAAPHSFPPARFPPAVRLPRQAIRRERESGRHNGPMMIVRLASVVFFFISVAPSCATEIRSIVDVLTLPRDLLDPKPEVAVVGAVIGVQPVDQQLIVEDASGGIRVAVPAATMVDSAGEVADVLVGDMVEVRGRIEPGAFIPTVRATRIVRRDRGPLPPPRRCDVEAFFAGSEDCRLVELEGVVQQAWHEAGSLLLEIETQTRLFTAEIPMAVVEQVDPGVVQDPQSLVDSVVCVAGPATSVLNARGEIHRAGLTVDRAEWFTLISADVTTRMSAVPLEAIGRFRIGAGRGHRVQTFGTVVHSIPGRTLHLQNGHRGVTVRLGAGAAGSEERFVAGDLVEVAGFVDRSGHVASIRSAAARKVGHHGPPEPLVAMPEEILRANAVAVERGTQADPGDYQGCLVRLGGHLLQSQPTADGGVLSVRCDRVIVPVEADPVAFRALAGIEPGSFVSVAGVAMIDWPIDPRQSSGDMPQRLRLMLRDAGDVRVDASPPWWTPFRLATFLVASGLILATALVWVWFLRRQLAAQQALLAMEMRSRRDAAVEYEATLRERTRLAANLHDTLQQTIGGIGYQLDACLAIEREVGSETRQHVDVARRMVRYAETEIQGAVWAMRSLSLGGRPLKEALKLLVARVGDGHDVRMTVEVLGTFEDLPEFVAGNLLLVCQEAVNNALRHGKPATIDVTVADGDDQGTIDLRVVDDGRGFVVGRQAGANEGHFGIQGMRERVERLGGQLTLASQPGKGTAVEATVLRREYDTRIDDDGAEGRSGGGRHRSAPNPQKPGADACSLG